MNIPIRIFLPKATPFIGEIRLQRQKLYSTFNECRTDRESRGAVRRDENPPVAATMAWPDPDYIRRVIEALRDLGDYKGGARGRRSDDNSEIQLGDVH